MRRLVTLLPLLAGALAFAACDSGSTTSVRAGAPSLTVKLTDAPGDLSEAWIKVQQIQFIGSDSTAMQNLTVLDTGWVNLLALTNNKTADLFTGTVPAGRYSQVRMTVCDMYIKTTDGQIIATPGAALPSGVTASSTSQLKLTSQCHSGFKINIPGDSIRLDSSTVNTFVIDFDAKRSFAHQAGNSGMWIVTPVLFGSLSIQSHPAVGSIAGAVALDTTVKFVKCGGDSLTADSLKKYFVPTAAKDTVVRTGAMSGSNYSITNLPIGTWTMGNDRVGFANGDTLSFTALATPATVPVTLGGTATSNYSISAASCKPHA